MAKKIYILTGAAGHLGQNLVQELLKENCEIRGFLLPTDKMVDLTNKNFKVYYGDVLDQKSLSDLFASNSEDELYVIHSAAIVSISSRFNKKMYRVNVEGTKNMIEQAKLHHVKKFVYISSVHAIPELPDNQVMSEVSFFDPNLVHGPYAKTKAEATQAVLDAVKDGLNACVVHPSGIIGPHDPGHGHLNALLKTFANHKLPACVKGGYDIVDVRDVAMGTIAALKQGRIGECYLLNNEKIQILDILNMVHEINGVKPVKCILPMWFAKMTAPLAEVYYKLSKKEPLFTRYSFYTLTSNSNFSHEKATKELSYHPRPMKETIKDTVAWLLSKNLIKMYPVKVK